MLGLASRYPAIGWEPVYMATAEAVTYSLYSQGHAYIEMKNGKKSFSLAQLRMKMTALDVHVLVWVLSCCSWVSAFGTLSHARTRRLIESTL